MICQASPAPDAFTRAELNAALSEERRVRGVQGRQSSAAAGRNSTDVFSIGKQAMGYVVTLKDDFGFVKYVTFLWSSINMSICHVLTESIRRPSIESIRVEASIGSACPSVRAFGFGLSIVSYFRAQSISMMHR